MRSMEVKAHVSSGVEAIIRDEQLGDIEYSNHGYCNDRPSASHFWMVWLILIN